MARRTSRGRQHIEMAKVKNESNLQVTFSKRRTGVFKKAHELSILCGAEVALIIFSPGQRVYSFGHPSVHTIIERFLKDQKNPSVGDSSSPMVLTTMTATNRIIHARRNAQVEKMNKELMQLEKQLEATKKRAEVLARAMKEDQQKQWWKRPIEDLDVNQLMIYATALEGLMKKVKNKMPPVSIEGGSAPFTDLIGVNDIYGHISLNADNFINQIHGRAEGGQVINHRRPSVAGGDDVQEDIDLNRSVSPSGSGSSKNDDNKKSVHVHQFI